MLSESESFEYFSSQEQSRIWQKYCGFLTFSLADFMEIQEHLLMEQIDIVHDSYLAKKFMPTRPKNMAEFRQMVPLTTYEDYADYLNKHNEDVLAVKPFAWARTSGRGGSPKWVPYTKRGMDRFTMSGVALMNLACTNQKDMINIGKGIRVLTNLPPPPYLMGVLSRVLEQYIDARVIPPLDKYANVDFEVRTRAGFTMALRTGVDLLTSLTSVLLKLGESFAESSGQMKFSPRMLHPAILFRLLRAWTISKIEGRAMLPKDLWPLKGLVCYGTDTSIYRDKIIHYWGKEPLEAYASTETGLLATQAWNKKFMTFLPFSCFLEFIPEEEWRRNRENADYKPPTVLLDEVEKGKCYEIIITNFYAMPFLRYRLGDLIKIVDLEDKELNIKTPQMVFVSRADGLIDIGGFVRLDEKIIWQAITNTGIRHEDWSARKEYEKNEGILHIYIELKEKTDLNTIEKMIHRELATMSSDYGNLESMLGMWPLRVTPLPVGSFKRYYEKMRNKGADLAHLKPPHMNAPDNIIQELSHQ